MHVKYSFSISSKTNELSFWSRGTMSFFVSMVIYMKSWISEGFNSLEFRIKIEYALQIKFLFQMLDSYLISIYLQEVVTIGWMLSWLQWKYDYT